MNSGLLLWKATPVKEVNAWVWLSLIPALITVILTFRTKKLIVSLFVGVLSGALLSKGLLGGITGLGEYMMGAIADKESAYTLSFLIAFGSLADLIGT